MKYSLLILFLFCCAGNISAQETDFTLDSSTAFYEGETISYVMTPPKDYRLVIYKAKFDGYSFAFVPREEFYDSASVLVGVHIYKIRGMTFEEALLEDTTSVRGYYGEDLILNPVDSMFNGTGDLLRTFYLDNKEQFIPNVMMSYFDGGTELVIFELVISPTVTRVTAENAFVDCLRRFKALQQAELGAR